MTNKKAGGQHALVIGASMAGLLAARILSDYFENVTVIERDQLSMHVEARKGVPQAKHTHLLMRKGTDIIAELFPDLLSDLEKDGALLLSPTEDFRWFHFGHWKLQFPGPLRVYSQSRPLLEYHVRRRVADRPNVRMFSGCQVVDLVRSAGSSSISGVRIRSCSNVQDEGYLNTTLIVDASGRGSQASSWLTSLGYLAAEETLVKNGVGYATRIYRRPSTFSSNWKAMSIYPWPLDTKRIGYIFPIEHNAWMVTLSGYLHDHPSANEAEFLAFARSLSRPDIYEAIKHAEPLGPISIHKFPMSRRRHYEHLSHMPDGLVVLGDAACSFNPIYGQGMTVAALEAKMLRDCLQRHLNSHATGDMTGFSHHFQKSLASVVEVPWLFAASEDFRYPDVQGKRLSGIGIFQGYTQRVCGLTARDPFATRSFYEVLNMLKPPTALFHPRILLPALFAPHKAPIANDSFADIGSFPELEATKKSEELSLF